MNSKIIFIVFYISIIVNAEKCNESLKKNLDLVIYTEANGAVFAKIRFRSFLDLNINCSSFTDQKIDLISLCPRNRNQFFSNYIDLKNLVNAFDFFIPQVKVLSLKNLNGFNLDMNKKSSYNFVHNLLIYDSKFKFYLNSSKQITNEYCSMEYFQHNKFTWAKRVRFDLILYEKNTCPLIFFSKSLEQITFSAISNSLIYKNQLEFIDLNETINYNLDSIKRNILLLEVEVAYVDINRKLINKDLFKNLQVLILSGYINSIQKNLFDYLPVIKFIHLMCDNLELIFKNDLKWIDYLNKYGTEDFTQTIYLAFVDNNFLFKNNYIYPDRDLCLFKDFPHKRLIYPVIISDIKFECTCTLIWLIQYSFYYLNEELSAVQIKSDMRVDSIRHCLERNTLKKYLKSCKFEEKFNKCHNKSISKLKKPIEFFIVTNLYYNYKWLLLIFEFYLRPIFCFFSFLSNLLTIILIRNQNDNRLKKNFKNVMYKYILVYSVFNMILSIIILFTLINTCIFPNTSYCSKIYKYETSQYYKILIYNFFGNTFRLSSNIAFITFSISRYFLSTSQPSKYFNMFQNLNHKMFTLFILIFSLVLSTFKLLEYKVNLYSGSIERNYPYDAYGVTYCSTDITELIQNKKRINFKCKLFNFLNIFNNVLNNIVFFFISIFIDIGLIRFTNQNLKRKKRLFENETSASLNEAIKLKQKINKMIITNGILYFITHIPEFVLTLVILFMDKKSAKYFMYRFSFIELNEMAQSFYFISFTLQIFVFLHFDKNFSKSFKNVFQKCF